MTLQSPLATRPRAKRVCIEDHCHSSGSTVSNSFSMIFSIRRFSFRNLERAPKCFIHGFPSGGRAWSFSFIASATKSRSVCPCRAATALASRKSVSGRSTVVFILSHIYSFTAKGGNKQQISVSRRIIFDRRPCAKVILIFVQHGF